MARLSGKVAIVTGGGGGIGSATAKVLAGEGAAVVVADIAEEPGTRIAEEILHHGGKAMYCPLDVSQKDLFTELAEAALSTYGRIDVLHNNAAATHLYAGDTDLLNIEVSVWDEIMAINARSVLLGCQAVIPAMLEQGSGSIINMSSTRAARGAMDLAAYASSKAAVDTFSKYVAVRYGKAGIRCNSIQPGFIKTPQSMALYAQEDETSRLMQHVNLAEPGTPADIAALVLFLASEESRYITGQTIRVDGGMLASQPFTVDSRSS